MTANNKERVTQDADSRNSYSEHARAGGDRVLGHEREEAKKDTQVSLPC